MRTSHFLLEKLRLAENLTVQGRPRRLLCGKLPPQPRYPLRQHRKRAKRSLLGAAQRLTQRSGFEAENSCSSSLASLAFGYFEERSSSTKGFLRLRIILSFQGGFFVEIVGKSLLLN